MNMADLAAPKETTDLIAAAQWQRYVYSRDRGHKDYITQAKRCEDMYLGAGRQWSEADRRQCEEVQGRKCVEVNTIFTTINTVMGEQIQTRADVSFRPRAGDATQEIADTLSKLTMQIADDNSYSWLESQVFGDGIIQQRGYFDMRMDFSDNLKGDIRITVQDPLEVLPDPDAQSADPKDWKDVIVTKWLSLDEIAQIYGQEAADLVAQNPMPETDFGDYEGRDERRNRFGTRTMPGTVYDSTLTDSATKQYRIIDRQHRRREKQQFYLNKNSDLRPVPFGTPKEEIAKKVDSGEWIVSPMVASRIRWTVTTINKTLHDEWSPYPHFTIFPFFPYFRRGVTLGLIDNAISPAETQNKAFANILHAINSVANSGWLVEKGSLTNMTTDDLADVGMKTGLVVEFARGKAKPEKIKPNDMPPGYHAVTQMAGQYIKDVTGVSNADDDIRSPEESGVAYDSKKFQAKMHLAVPLDNLARTRNLLFKGMLALIQEYYTEERIIMITKPDDMGETTREPMVINQRTPAGEIINNLTLGEYDLTIADVPHAASFQATQFRELLEMKKVGIDIPGTSLVEVSSISKKRELIQQMTNVDPEAVAAAKARQAAETKEIEATADLKTAQAEKQRLGVVVDGVTAAYSSVQTAQVMATVPGIVPVADEILKSAGFVDKNRAPIFIQPASPVLGLPAPHASTSPEFPAKPAGPALGMNTGIETQRLDGVSA